MNSFTLPPQVKGLIFDCDGTLADTMPMHWRGWHAAFKHYGYHCPQSFLDLRAGIPTDRLLEQFNREFNATIDLAGFRAQKDKHVDDELPSARAIEPIVAIAKAYHGKLPLAVASGGSFFHVKMILEAVGVFDLFEAFVTADDHVAPKPSPEIFLEAARQIEVTPAHCIVFEDAPPGMAGAKAAGMLCVDVNKLLVGQEHFV